MSVDIDYHIITEVEQHLEAAYPHEACGFLLGQIDEDQLIITHLIDVENKSTENQRRRFVMDPLDYLKAERFAGKHDLTLLGIYHSHPDHPAIPSQHDLEYAQPFFIYFIHTIAEGHAGDAKAYRLEAGKFEEVLFHIRISPAPAFS